MFQWLRRRPVAPPLPGPAADQELTPRPLKLTRGFIDELRRRDIEASPRPSPFRGLPKPPPGVRPSSDPTRNGMAMDDAANCAPGGAWGAWATQAGYGEGLYFPGYAYLSELAQRPEYRNMAETVAEEMTRKWIKLVSTGDEDKTDKITALDAAMKEFNVRDTFNRGMERDGFFGMGMIYLDTGKTDDRDELVLPLLLNEKMIPKGSFRGFVGIDPLWVSPINYNSIDAMKPDFFVPQSWYILTKAVHASRLIILRSREVPDLLKPSYNFGGLSLSQVAKPYVDNWLRTRQSVSDLLHAFTTWILKTNLANLAANASAFADRMAAFVFGRDNRGLLVVDKDGEDLTNVSAPLGTLDHLQAQSQEQMASVSQIPIIKLLGITPTGLNATGEDEIRVWYDRVKAKQEKVFGPALTVCLQVLQLHLFGVIDDEIGFEFVPLWELDSAGRAAVEKIKADTDAVYMADQVITNQEVRDRLAADPESPYHGLEGKAPEPEPLDDPDLDDDADRIGRVGAEGENKGANSGV